VLTRFLVTIKPTLMPRTARLLVTLAARALEPAALQMEIFGESAGPTHCHAPLFLDRG